jgi:hypothetical protein
MQILGVTNADIGARGVAGVALQNRPYALIVLDGTACQAYKQTGSAHLEINNGAAIVNSSCNSPESAYMDGTTIVTSDGLDYYKRGEWNEYGSASTTPDPTKVAKPIEDPLAGLTRPVPCGGTGLVSDGTCITKSSTSNGTPSAPQLTVCPSGGSAPCPLPSGTAPVVLQPGTYYGGLKIEGGGGREVQFAPGLYVFAGGTATGCPGGGDCRGFIRKGSNPLSVLSSAPATAGVTFFNTDDPHATDSSLRSCGPIQIQGTTSANLRAPNASVNDGPLDDMPVDASDQTNGVEDMLFWIDDDCTDPNPTNCLAGMSGACAFDYAGGNTYTATGVFYVPGGTFHVTGGGAADSAIQVIVKKFLHNGTLHFSITYTGFVPTEVPWLRLVE